MKKLYTSLRALVAFFGFTVFLGVIWFAGSPGGEVGVVPAILMAFSSLAVALIPARKLLNVGTRRILVVLCIVGVGAGIALVASDISTSQEIEWDVITIRLLHIVALATMAVLSIIDKQLQQKPA